MRRVSGAILLLCIAAHGQSAAPIVTVRAIPPSGGFKAGEPAVLTLELAIREPFHINSDRPLQSYLVPTTVQFVEIPGVTFGKVVFPPAPARTLPISNKPMSVYEGTVNLTVEVAVPGMPAEQRVTIQGNVRYQACNNKNCLPSRLASFSLTVPVSARTGPAASPAAAETKAAATAAAAPGTAFGERGLLLTLLLVFAGGLALNLTPCVYPMIPLTIAYFGGQSRGKRGSLFLHSSLYVLGMALTYSILGSVAALTGSLFGSALQYPPVLIGIALVMVLLALSMFDVYEVRMPMFLSRLAGGSQHRGWFGTFFMGLTVGIVAAPCIGPFVLGLLTYVGKKANALLGFTLFFVLALGLGLPFLFLAAFSGSLSRLPRSGAWMIWVRKIFGFVLIGMAIYFVRPIVPNRLVYSLTASLAMLVAGIYMAWIEPTQAKGSGFVFLRNAVGLAFFGTALYFAVTGIQAHIDEAVAAKLQTISSDQPGVSSAAIRWYPYSDAKLEDASRQGKPVFIDFYADWCLPCKELDEQTFSAADVISASKDFIMLKVDLTSADDPKAAALQQKYGARGVPTLVFLKPDGTEMPGLRMTGFETKDVFLGRMKQALEAAGTRNP